MLCQRGIQRHLKNISCFIQARHRSDQNKTWKIGFIGLGNMGSQMCKNLIWKNFDVMVKDVSAEREKRLADEGAKVAGNLQDIAEHSDYVVTMLPASQHVLDLYLSDKGLMRNLKTGTVAVDCSTVDFTTSIALGEKLKEKHVSFIDAPVSGGVPAAEKGTLTFMVGGDQSVLAQVEPILMAMGSKIFHCGGLGTGQIVKMCNNLLLAISAAGVSEVFNLGQKLALDPKLLNAVVNQSSGRCWVTELYHPVPNIYENVPSSKSYKAGFTSQMILKDIRIAEKAASEVQCSLHLGNVVSKIYDEICHSKQEEKDFTYIYEHLKNT